jgi:hypothetical protein
MVETFENEVRDYFVKQVFFFEESSEAAGCENRRFLLAGETFFCQAPDDFSNCSHLSVVETGTEGSFAVLVSRASIEIFKPAMITPPR